MKDQYNESPDTQMNIYISGQDNGVYGVLLGIATFPWDPNATQARGGLWLNSQYVGTGQGTASHEMGHCLGLWHTHHGVSETSGCADDCYENAHARNDANADYVGDFCKDTMPTPTNYNCSAPGGTDCNGASWGQTDTGNFMGYAPDSCYDHFSNEQASRMHCWSRDMLPGLIITQNCSDPAPAAPSSLTATASGSYGMNLSWNDNSGNEDGFTVTRNGTIVANLGANATSYSDSGLDCETSYNYAVYAGNCGGDSGSATAVGTTGTCPSATAVHVGAIDWAEQEGLSSGSTRIAFNLHRNAEITLDVYDVRGHLVRRLVDGASMVGEHSVTWDGVAADGQRASAGTYLFRLNAGGEVATGRVLLVK